MPVPKRKVSKSRRDKRSSTWALKKQSVALCFSGACDGEPKQPHQVCLKCGFYKGKKVLTTKQDRALSRAESRKADTARRGTAEQPHVEPVEAEAAEKKVQE